MLKRHNRFFGHNGVQYVYRSGYTVRGQYCQIKYTVNMRRKSYRLAVVVSKKVAKNAVVRNRIRRRIYEIIRLEAPVYLTNQDMVLTIFDAKIADMDFEHLRASIATQLDFIKSKTKDLR